MNRAKLIIILPLLLVLCLSGADHVMAQDGPDRKDRIRMAKELREKKVEQRRAKRAELRAKRAALRGAGTERERKALEKQLRREGTLSAKRNIDLRKVRAQKRRIRQITKDSELEQKKFAWRIAQIEVGIQIAQNEGAKELEERLVELKERNENLWARKRVVLRQMEGMAQARFRESRDSFRRTQQSTLTGE